MGIFDITMQHPLLVKPFDEAQPEKKIALEKIKRINANILTAFKEEELTDGVQNSINAFVKNNPDLFPDSKVI
jgi:hypothetical protein